MSQKEYGIEINKAEELERTEPYESYRFNPHLEGLRDKFAIAALPVLLDKEWEYEDILLLDIAKKAYLVADQMLAARKIK